MKQYNVTGFRSRDDPRDAASWLPLGSFGARPAAATAAGSRSRVPMALAGSLAVHGATALMLVWIASRVVPPSAPEPAVVAVVFASPAAVPASVAPTPVTEAAPPVPEPPPAPAPPAEPDLLPQLPAPEPAVSTTAALTVPPPPTALVPEAAPIPAPLPPPPPTASVPLPQPPQTPPPPKRPSRQLPLRPQTAISRPAAAQVAPVVPGPAASAETPAAPAAAPTAQPSAISAGWRSALGAWLQANKSYPEEARRRAVEGRAVVRFTVGRDGRVLEFQILSSTNSATLDAAIDRLLRGAHLPSFPPEMVQPQVTVTLQIRYSLEQ